MAHTKAIGSTQLGRDSQPKYLGVKVSDGQGVGISEVLVRQRGTRYSAGKNVKVGRDHTLFSVVSGNVKFGTRLGKKTVSIV